MSLAKELLENFEPEIADLTLHPAEGGRFDVQVNDALVYSKLETGRHALPGEVLGLVQAQLLKEREDKRV